MVFLVFPKVDPEPEDFDLSKAKRQVLLALWDRAKTANEISKEIELNISTVFKSLDSLEEKKMTIGEQINIKKIVSGITVEETSDEKYWKPTKKGYAWVYNLAEAYDFSKDKLAIIKKKLEDMKLIRSV